MSLKKTFRIPLRVVFYREGDIWFAHCLEFDLIGDGATKAEAFAMLNEAMDIQVRFSIEKGNLSNLFRPADGEILEKFAAGKDIVRGEFQLQFERPEKDCPEIDLETVREYDGCEGELVPV